MIPLNYPNDPVEGFEHLELGFPWIVVESAEKINEMINENDVVFEAGTGGSTIFFAKRCKSMTAIETSSSWADSVSDKMCRENISNVNYVVIPNEEDIVSCIKNTNTDDVTIFSVDTQGGYCRSKILNAFLKKGISSNLRMIVLDNYGHEGLFPDHWDKENFMGEGWEVLTFTHPRWAGFGTRIYIKK
jgi:hypothetical protein